MRGRTALAILSTLLLVSACIPLEINVEIVPKVEVSSATDTPSPAITTPIPSPLAIFEITPSATPSVFPTPKKGLAPSPPLAADRDRAVEAARRHLAEMLGVSQEQITLLHVETATWRDASLGCGQPSRGYAQVITPGFRILLEHNGQRYELHSDQSGNFVIVCHIPARIDRIPLRRIFGQDEIVERARQHLSLRLSVPLESVVTVSVEAAEWDDPSLGCGYLPGMQPDRAYPRGIPGYRILLDADGGRYEYHSGGLWLVFCGPEGR